MRIIYFSRDYTPHDYRFLSALASTGHQVAFLRLEDSGRKLESRPLPDGISSLSWLGEKAPAHLRDGMHLLTELKRVIGTYQPDIIHAGPLQTSALLVALAGFRPLVSMSWGYDLLFDAERNVSWRWATRFTLKRSIIMVGDCDTIRQRAVAFGMPDERIVTFPWGVDINHFSNQRQAASSSIRQHLGWHEDDFVIISTRNWSALYGVEGLARAFVRVAQQRPEVRLLLLGDGPQAPLLRQILSDGGVLDRVHFAGQKKEPDLPEYYRAADLYISTSHSDGTSISLLEAMACGCAVLLSDIPGNREWVIEQETNPVGWLFPDGNEAALTEAILRALAQRQHLPEMGCAGRRLVEQRGDWTKNFPKLLQAYEMAREVIMRTVAIIQARYSSSRLPGKVLLDIAGQPMLARVVERTRRASMVDEVVVATTTDPADDAVASFCQARGYAHLRGSLYDVLDRYYQAARAFQAEVIVRITADCPMIDAGIVDHTVQEFFRAGVDFAANRLPPPWKRTYPIGLDTEVCTFAALEKAWREASLPHYREHVMPYLYEAAITSQQPPGGPLPDTFRVLIVNHEVDYGHLRWTVDTPQDLELARQVYASFAGRDDFTWQEILALYQQHPELAQINVGVPHKTVRDIDERGAV